MRSLINFPLPSKKGASSNEPRHSESRSNDTCAGSPLSKQPHHPNERTLNLETFKVQDPFCMMDLDRFEMVA
ncbi:hypothetical protein TNCV_4085751 [Trichonephila clavipes]|nr:hypothetical protein TNCV_4085751 [Trichonephila clavipes]